MATGDKRLTDGLVVLVFIVGLILPWAGMWFPLDPTPAPAENRILEAKPSAPRRLRDLPAYTMQYRLYFSDHFGFRRLLLRWNADLKLAIGESPSAKVLVGRNGWLFYSGNAAVDDHAGQHPLPPAGVRAWIDALEDRRQFMETRGGQYLFVVPPDKTTVYPEYLPAGIEHLGPSTMEQILLATQEQRDSPFFVLDGPLRSAKGDGLVYYRTDTHWTSLGKRTASQAILGQLGVQLPLMRTEYETRKVAFELGGDLSRMLDAIGRFSETIENTQPTAIALRPHISEEVSWYEPSLAQRLSCVVLHLDQRDAGSSALMFGDSFGEGVAPYLAMGFDRLTFVPMFPDSASFRALVARFRPSVVIEERTERYLKYPPRAAPDRENRNKWMAAE